MAQVAAINPQGLPADKQGFVVRLSQRLAHYREYRRVYRELESLSDRELADVGISRHNIAEVAKAAAYGS